MDKTFNIIYIDPPYGFANWTKKKNGAAASHYAGMKDKEIASLPIGDLAAENCAMLLWMPSVKIAEGLHIELFRSWGFRPVCITFVWRKIYKNGKPYTGIGFYSRNDAEFCLLGIKGRMPKQSNKVLQTLDYPVGKHSAKPPLMRDKIVELFGDKPRIELFSRVPKKFDNGWVHAGYEVDGQDIRMALQQIKDGVYDLVFDIATDPSIKILQD